MPLAYESAPEPAATGVEGNENRTNTHEGTDSMNPTVSRTPAEVASFLALEPPVDITELSVKVIGSGDQSLEIELERIEHQGRAQFAVLFTRAPGSGGDAEIHPSNIPHLVTALQDLYRTWQNQNHAEDN